jgi:hypothetical protein
VFRRSHLFSSPQIDSVEIATNPSSSVQTSRHEDPLVVDIQVEEEHLVARPEVEEPASSILEGVEEVRTTFSCCINPQAPNGDFNTG